MTPMAIWSTRSTSAGRMPGRIPSCGTAAANPGGTYTFEVSAEASDGSDLSVTPRTTGKVTEVSFKDGSAYSQGQRTGREYRRYDFHHAGIGLRDPEIGRPRLPSSWGSLGRGCCRGRATVPKPNTALLLTRILMNRIRERILICTSEQWKGGKEPSRLDPFIAERFFTLLNWTSNHCEYTLPRGREKRTLLFAETYASSVPCERHSWAGEWNERTTRVLHVNYVSGIVHCVRSIISAHSAF